MLALTWYPGLCIVGTLGFEWAGLALEKRLPSNRLRSLNVIPAVLQFLSIDSVQKVQAILGYAANNNILHANTHMPHTHYGFVIYPQLKLFIYCLLTLVLVWCQISSTSKWSGPGVIYSGPIPWSQSQRRILFFRKLFHSRHAAC